MNFYKERFVYVDTETTDKKPGQIAQLAYVLASWEGLKMEVEEAKSLYFSVDSVSPGAEAVHGLSVAALRILSGGKTFYDQVDNTWNAWYSDAIFVAHNAQFDIRFVKAELERAGLPFQPPSVFCTMQAMTKECKLPNRYQGGYKWPTVGEALRHIGADEDTVMVWGRKLFGEGETEMGFHDARFDVTGVVMLHYWLRKKRMEG